MLLFKDPSNQIPAHGLESLSVHYKDGGQCRIVRVKLYTVSRVQVMTRLPIHVQAFHTLLNSGEEGNLKSGPQHQYQNQFISCHTFTYCCLWACKGIFLGWITVWTIYGNGVHAC